MSASLAALELLCAPILGDGHTLVVAASSSDEGCEPNRTPDDGVTDASHRWDGWEHQYTGSGGVTGAQAYISAYNPYVSANQAGVGRFVSAWSMLAPTSHTQWVQIGWQVFPSDPTIYRFYQWAVPGGPPNNVRFGPGLTEQEQHYYTVEYNDDMTQPNTFGLYIDGMLIKRTPSLGWSPTIAQVLGEVMGSDDQMPGDVAVPVTLNRSQYWDTEWDAGSWHDMNYNNGGLFTVGDASQLGAQNYATWYGQGPGGTPSRDLSIWDRSCMHNPVQMGLDSSGDVFARNTVPGPSSFGWTQEVTGGITKVAAGRDGLQMIVDSGGNLWARSGIGPGGWTEEVVGGVSKIAAGDGGLQVIVDWAGNVWARNNIGSSGWTEEVAGGINAVSAGDGGLQTIIDAGGNLWARSGIGSSGWTEEVVSGIVAVSAGGNGLQMVLNSGAQLWAKNTIGVGGFTQEATGQAAISAGGYGLQMILDKQGYVWAKNSIGSSGWYEEVAGGQTAIAAGNTVQMILDNAGKVWAKYPLGYAGWTGETTGVWSAVSAG